MACRIPEHVDLAIAGAGPVGATLALLAAQAGRKVALIEARPALAGTTGKDPRVLALSWGSQQILQRVGAWPADLPATPIDSVHVSQHSGLGRVLIQRQDLDLPHLGFTVGYAALNDALAAYGAQLDSTLSSSAMSKLPAAKIVNANSANSANS